MSNANLQQSAALRIEAVSINCLALAISVSAANRNLLIIAESLQAQYVEYLLLMRLIILIHLIRRTPRAVTDGAGRMMTDTSGASQLSYKPYGEVNRMNSYGPDIFRYKYTSQQDDQDTGLYYYNARYYDPVLGSFTSADNVTNATSSFGLNHYMYTEGNPVRYGDASGNFLLPLLYSAMAVAVGATIGLAVVAAAATLAVTMAVVNTVMTASAMAQTAALATAAFAVSAVVAAVRFAIFVNALGTIGAGIGFVAGGIESKGNLQGALAGAEIGFKIGTAITVAAWVVVGAFYIGAYVGAAIEAGIAFLGLHPAIAWILTYTLNFTIGGLFGELAKALGSYIGGHWVPLHKSKDWYRRPLQRKHGYNEKGAYHGRVAGDFLSSGGSMGGGLWDATAFGNDCILNGPTYHSLDRMGAEIVGTGSFYFTEKIMGTVFQNTFDSAAWSALRKPQTFGSY